MGMSSRLSLLSALGCLLAGGVAYAATPSKPDPKPEKPFVARSFQSAPAAKPVVQAVRAEPKPRPEQQTTTIRNSKPRPKARPAKQKAKASQPATAATAVAVTASAGLVESEWEPVVQYYSGGSYGVSHINKLASKSGDGGVSGDRQMVASAAARYGIPFALLWGTYGAESSYGTNSGGGSKPPYFGLTQSYPGPPSTAFRGTSGNFLSDAAKAARSWAKNYKLKLGRWPSTQAQAALGR